MSRKYFSICRNSRNYHSNRILANLYLYCSENLDDHFVYTEPVGCFVFYMLVEISIYISANVPVIILVNNKPNSSRRKVGN